MEIENEVDQRKILVEKIKNGKYTQDQLVTWVLSLPSSIGNRKPRTFKKGDVFMHSIFKHPYVLLKDKKDYWICGLLTSNQDYTDVLEECNSRFFTGSHFTRTLFTTTAPEGTWINVYDNKSQLKNVIKQLNNVLK